MSEEASITKIPIKVALRIFDEKERWHLAQVLTQSAQRSGHDVLTLPAAEADVIFVNPEEPGAQVFLSAQPKRRRPIAVVYSDEPAGDTLHLPKPAQSKSLIPLLERLASRLRELPAASHELRENSKTDHPVPVPTKTFSVTLDHLGGAAFEQKPFACRKQDQPLLLVDPAKGKAWLPMHMTQSALGSLYRELEDIDEQSFSSLAQIELARMLQTGHFHSIPLEELTWSISFLSIPHKTNEERILEQPVRMTRWPNFARLQHSPVHLKWSAMLMRQPLTLSRLTADADGDFTAAARFYNACLLSGLMRNAEQLGDRVERKQGGRGKIFRKILEKLRA